jgi:hypothetical protein
LDILWFRAFDFFIILTWGNRRVKGNFIFFQIFLLSLAGYRLMEAVWAHVKVAGRASGLHGGIPEDQAEGDGGRAGGSAKDKKPSTGTPG